MFVYENGRTSEFYLFWRVKSLIRFIVKNQKRLRQFNTFVRFYKKNQVIDPPDGVENVLIYFHIDY